MRTINRQRANLIFSSILDQISIAEEEVPDIKKRSKFWCPVPDEMEWPEPESVMLQERVFERDGVLRWKGKVLGYCKLGVDLGSVIWPEPESVMLQERVFERDGVLRWKGKVLGYCKLGVDLGSVIKCFGSGNAVTGSHLSDTATTLSKLFDVFKYEKYVVWYDEPRKTFLVVLEEGAETCDMLSAWMFALWFAKSGKPPSKTMMEALGHTAAYMRSIDREIFQRLGELDWDLETGAMETKSGVRIRRPENLKAEWRGR